MKVKHIPLYLLVGILSVIIWALRTATNEEGKMFPGLPFAP